MNGAATTVTDETETRSRSVADLPPLLINVVAFAIGIAIWWAITAAKLVVLPGPYEVLVRAG